MVSVGGSLVPDAALQAARTHDLPITVALDNDQAGEHGWHGVLDWVRSWGASFVARFRRVVPRLMGWEVKDWNELVRAETVEAARVSVSVPEALSPSALAERPADPRAQPRQYG